MLGTSDGKNECPIVYASLLETTRFWILVCAIPFHFHHHEYCNSQALVHPRGVGLYATDVTPGFSTASRLRPKSSPYIEVRLWWCAPILYDPSSRSLHAALEAQAESFGRFAVISQGVRLVPVVEPDVDFNVDASLASSVEVHAKIIAMIYARCAAYRVLSRGKTCTPMPADTGMY